MMNEIENALKQLSEYYKKAFRISNVNPHFVKTATSESIDQAVLIMLERTFHISFAGMDMKEEDEGHSAESLLEKCLTEYSKKIQKDYQSSVFSVCAADNERIIKLHDQLALIHDSVAILRQLVLGIQAQASSKNYATN